MSASAAACYSINGTQYDTATTYIPCNLTAVANNEHSQCCAVGDYCLTNGLCRNPGNDADGTNYYWRVGCTDSTFKDPSCPNYCKNGGDDPNDNHMIFNCVSPETNWACAPIGYGLTSPVVTSGCNDEAYTFSAAVPVVYATAKLSANAHSGDTTSTVFSSVSQATSAASGGSRSTAPTTAATTTAAHSSATASAASSSDNSSGLSTGAKAGLGVGISLGVVCIALVGVIFWLLRRRKSAAEKDPAELGATNEYSPPAYHEHYKQQASPPAEMDTAQMPAEMPAGNPHTVK